MHIIRTSGLRILTHIAAPLPLAILIWDFSQGQLTADPIREITLRTGRTTLILLVASLSCTPINIAFGIKQVIPLRRTLGLYTFLYASLHFLTFLGLDYGFDFGLIREDIFEKRFAIVGFAAFLSLLTLAVTSTRGWRRRLGKNWERLHWFAYVAGGLAITHFALQVRKDLRVPLIYGAVVVLLLIIRLPSVRKVVGRFRNRLERKWVIYGPVKQNKGGEP